MVVRSVLESSSDPAKKPMKFVIDRLNSFAVLSIASAPSTHFIYDLHTSTRIDSVAKSYESIRLAWARHFSQPINTECRQSQFAGKFTAGALVLSVGSVWLWAHQNHHDRWGMPCN